MKFNQNLAKKMGILSFIKETFNIITENFEIFRGGEQKL